MKVIVASKNPIKVSATKDGFKNMFPNEAFVIEGAKGPSGVSDQPMTDQETYQGALNRVIGLKERHPDADYWVGIEGGIEKGKDDGMDAFAWVVIQSKTQTGQSRTASFSLPPKIVNLINQGYELGDADDIVFKQSNTKQKSGAVGLLTDNAIDRASLYAPAITFALIPFKNQHLYPEKMPVLDKTG